VAFFYASGSFGPRDHPWPFYLPRDEDNEMITIDIVDDNNERTAKPVVQTIPIVRNGRSEGFDSAYDAARSFFGDLLRLADPERQVNKASAPANRDLVSTLNRIVRALTAWL
jgi:hypothetical protein